MSPGGRPMAVRPLAKPKPCRRPKAKATTHGRRMVKLVSPRQDADDLRAEEKDRESNRGVERRRGNARITKRRSGKGDAVGDRKGADGLDQHPRASDDEQEAEHEQEMVGAEQDVLDPLRHKHGRGRERAARRGDLDIGARRMDELGRMRPVEPLDAHEHVGDGELKAKEIDPLAFESDGAGVDPAPLDARIRQFVHLRLMQIADSLRHLQHERQGHARHNRRPPQHVVVSWRGLLEVEIGGPDFVGVSRRQRAQRNHEAREPSHEDSRAAHFGITSSRIERIAAALASILGGGGAPSGGGAGNSTVYLARISS